MSGRNWSVAAYNQAINVFWTVINLGPITIFCYGLMELHWLYIFLLISLPTGFVPARFLRFIQLSKTTGRYNRLGIRTVKKFTQDGDIINRLIRKKLPDYNLGKANTIEKNLAKANMNERFHFIVFVFFLLTGVYALAHRYWWWSLLIGVNNLVFNVYPILLQQYNRIRLTQLKNRQMLNAGLSHRK